VASSISSSSVEVVAVLEHTAEAVVQEPSCRKAFRRLPEFPWLSSLAAAGMEVRQRNNQQDQQGKHHPSAA
jgi:hypothetical protein